MPYKDKEKEKENHRKWQREHPEKVKEERRQYLEKHPRTWMIRNCLLCGRFLRKHQRQFCSECSKELRYPDTEAKYYWENREKILERENKRNRELREILSRLPNLFSKRLGTCVLA